MDRLFTRIGASDELHTGQSTFMVEMTETANILNNATDRSLVILDEIGRGTSTLDGLSLAWAIAEHIAANLRCRTLFATHYHELTDLAQRFRGVKNLNVAVREWEDQVVFLHRIVEGGTDRSYGIHVARLAGVPKPVLERARQLLIELAVQHVGHESHGAAPPHRKRFSASALRRSRQRSRSNAGGNDSGIHLAGAGAGVAPGLAEATGRLSNEQAPQRAHGRDSIERFSSRRHRSSGPRRPSRWVEKAAKIPGNCRVFLSDPLNLPAFSWKRGLP